MLRLLGGRPLPAALETSRRYARWRARHLSHLLENCVLEHSPEDPRRFEDVYEDAGDVLGKGGYGVVFLVKRKADGEAFACKRLDLRRLSATGLRRLHEEVAALRALDHPHICRLREVFYSDAGRHCDLILDLCDGGELFRAVDERADPGKRPPFSERRAAQLLGQMLRAVRYIHKKGICHRDLKLENWLFDDKDVDGVACLKLVDFGLAGIFGPKRPKSPVGLSRNHFDERVGSAYYCAPEVLGRDYDPRCDLWSVGVIGFMLLCGAPPFWGGSDREILKRVKTAPLKFPEELFRGVSADAKDLVAGLLDRDVDKRFTADQALAHPFLAGADSALGPVADALAGAADSLAGVFLAEEAPAEQAFLSPLADALRTFARLNALTKLVVEVAAAQLPPHHLLALRDDFLAADTDGDGVLSLGELRAALGKKIDDAEFAQLFAAVDVDARREISFHEFVAAALTRRVDLDDRALQVAFEAIDSEGLGYITPEAVRATMGLDAASYGSVDDVARALALADADGDGRVDYAEFLDYVRAQRLEALLGKAGNLEKA